MGMNLNVRFTMEDLIGPGLTRLIRQNQEMTRRMEIPHRVQVDASQATGALSGIMGLVGKLGLAAAFATGAKAIVGLGADMEATRLRYEVFTGSADRAGQAIDIVAKLATKTPFAKTELLEYGQQLLGAGLGADEMGRKLTVLGNISSATGKNLGELTSLFVKNKGNGLIQGEDLNQLADAKIPLQDFAAILGTNVQGLRKMGEQGKLTFNDLDKYFEKLGGTQGKWGTLNERMSNTLIGKWSNLKDTVEQMMSSAGEGQVPILGKLLDSGNAALTWVSEHLDGIKKVFAPLQDAIQPLLDTFQRLWQEQYGNADTGTVLATVFNRIGNVIKLVSPFVKIAATLLGTVWEQGQRVVGVLTKFWETSPRLQKFFAGLYTGALAAFKGIAEAVGKYLGGAGTFIEGVFSGDFHKMSDGLKQTLFAIADTQKIGTKAAEGFVDGYEKGIKLTDFFGPDKPGGQKSRDLLDEASSSSPKKPAAMTAAASKGPGSGIGAAGSGRVVNITLNANNPFRDAKFYVQEVGAGAKNTADQFRDWLVAELNDVNTIASNF